MKKTICFLGGIHGAGKTTLCTTLLNRYGWVFTKQKYLITDITRGLGVNGWEDSAKFFNSSIELAGQLMISLIEKSQSDYALVDCHYAIRASKALRHTLDTGYSDYIADLDSRFIRVIARSGIGMKFVLLDVNTSLALQRVEDRPKEFLGYENTLVGINFQRIAEQRYLAELISEFKVDDKNVLNLKNNTNPEIALDQVSEFIKRPF